MEKTKKTSDSQIAASRRYDEKAYDRITWRVPKGKSKEYLELAKPDTLNGFITKAVNEKLNGVSSVDIPDLAVYAKSAKLSQEEYIKQAVLEKMQRQDESYTETVEHIKDL